MGKKDFMKKTVVSIAGTFRTSPEKMRKWVERVGGRFYTTIHKDTTHLVVSDHAWKKQDAIVLEALRKDDTIDVVTFEWLEDCFRDGRLAHSTTYLWTTISARNAKRDAQKLKLQQTEAAKAAREAEREKKREMKELERIEKAKSKVNYAAALTEHTDAFMSAAERTRALSSELRYLDGVAVSRSKKAKARAKGKGGKSKIKQKAKVANEFIFSDRHHVYKDMGGFPFHIVLSKVDILKNRNERIFLTIYESNGSPPHSYMTHCRMVGTDKPLQNSTPSALGSNFQTAFRVFRKTFQDYTNVDWNERFTAFEKQQPRQSALTMTLDRSNPASAAAWLAERRRQRLEQRDQKAKDRKAEDALLKEKAKAMKIDEKRAETDEERKRREDREWERKPFIYRVPPPGQPRGLVGSESGDTSQSIQGGSFGGAGPAADDDDYGDNKGTNLFGMHSRTARQPGAGPDLQNPEVIDDDDEEDRDDDDDDDDYDMDLNLQDCDDGPEQVPMPQELQAHLAQSHDTGVQNSGPGSEEDADGDVSMSGGAADAVSAVVGDAHGERSCEDEDTKQEPEFSDEGAASLSDMEDAAESLMDADAIGGLMDDFDPARETRNAGAGAVSPTNESMNHDPAVLSQLKQSIEQRPPLGSPFTTERLLDPAGQAFYSSIADNVDENYTLQPACASRADKDGAGFDRRAVQPIVVSEEHGADGADPISASATAAKATATATAAPHGADGRCGVEQG